MSAFDTVELSLTGLDEVFGGAYNIGYWPWELPRFPDVWCEAYRLVNEVWAASRYTGASFKANSPVPVRVLPPAVEVPDLHILLKEGRDRLESKPIQFIYPFDRNSYVSRKNPVAAIKAFSSAFPDVGGPHELLLRVNGEPGPQTPLIDLYDRIADDGRIQIQEGTLSRTDALRVLAKASCLISPHRAEGFGRNIAEAIALQVPVFATAFGGCCDFLIDDESIPWLPIPTSPADYPYAENQFWADPDVNQLARSMRSLANKINQRQSTQARYVRRAADLDRVYSASAAGIRYRRRLYEILEAL